MSACRSCGEAVPEGARFCPGCGTAAAVTRSREARKVVTVLFCDLASSTSLAERLEPEALRRVLARYFSCAREAVEHHGGTVEKFIGDAVMAVFGVPVVHEDDALRAVRAAVELRDAVGRLNEDNATLGIELVVRTGVNTGEVVVGEGFGEMLVTGNAVVIAKRLEEEAPPGGVLIGPWTFALVRDAVEVEALAPLTLKGKETPIAAYVVRALHSGAPGRARRLDSPLVGRTGELEQLRAAFVEAKEARECRVVTVVGPAGIGKTRLTHELASEVADARVLKGRCLPYGEGITYWPLVEIIRDAAGLTGAEQPVEVRSRIGSLAGGCSDPERVASGVAATLGLGDEVAADEPFWAVRSLLEQLARAQPVLVVIDDLQWAETGFLDLLEYLGSRSRASPLLLCCLARPEFLDLRPLWTAGRDGGSTIVLDALPLADSRKLVGNLLGSDLPSGVRDRVLTAANGNPLFVEELLRMLIDDETLHRTEEGWRIVGDHARLALPPTINALLSARLDRLPAEEREVLEHAAVIGEVFSWSAVAELAAAERRPSVGTHLQGLVRKQLIRPEPPSAAGEDEFRFGHILVRDAAYACLPKDARAELHERVARLIDARFSGGIEVDEIGGYHLEQASRARAAFHPFDQRAKELAQEAADRLGAAARRAVTRGDSGAAASLLERTLQLLPPDDPDRAPLLVEFADALRLTGRLDEAGACLADAVAFAESGGLAAVARRAHLDGAFLGWYTSPEEGTDALLDHANAAIELFGALGEDAHLAHAWRIAADVHWIRCEIGRMQAVLERALAVAEAANSREQGNIRSSLALAATFGPTHTEEALKLCHELASQSEGDRSVGAMLHLFAAYLEACLGRFEEARAEAREARGSLEELGKRVLLASQRLFAGKIELLAGDAVAAESHFRDGYDTLKALGVHGNVAGLGVHLALALHAQGRDDEVNVLLDEAAEVGSPDDLEVQVLRRVSHARIRAAAGAFGEAEAIACEAIAIAEQTDAPNIRADAQLALAVVLRDEGRDTEAEAAAKRARELYEAKGNLIGAREAGELLAPSARLSAG